MRGSNGFLSLMIDLNIGNFFPCLVGIKWFPFFGVRLDYDGLKGFYPPAVACKCWLTNVLDGFK